MDTFYVTPEEFWARFNSDEAERPVPSSKKARMKNSDASWPETTTSNASAFGETEMSNQRGQVPKSGERYVILYGRHRPGKKNKTWEDDGYLSLIGQMAYVTDTRGRLLEEPTVLLPEDYEAVKDMSELLVGKTEIQVIELDRKE